MEEKSTVMTRSNFHTFNSGDTEFHSYPPKAMRTIVTMDMGNHATMIEEKGTSVILRLVGTVPCYDQLRNDTWTHKINIMEIVGLVHSGIQMWKLVCLFKNLKEVRVSIVGQNPPADQNITKPQDMELNGSVTHMKIFSDWVSDGKRPEYNQGIVSLIIFSLKMALKCTQLCSFHIEIPDDYEHRLNIALKDFVVRSNFGTDIILKVKERKILCIQPPVVLANIDAVRELTPPEQLLPPEQRRIMAPPPPVVGSGVPQNTPVHLSSWNSTSLPKRRKTTETQEIR